MNQQDFERLEELEELFEIGDLDRESDEEEWEELKALRADNRTYGREKKLLAKWGKAKKVWRIPNDDGDTIDGFVYAMTYTDLRQILYLDSHPDAELETWLKDNAQEVERPSDLGQVVCEYPQEMFWFPKPE